MPYEIEFSDEAKKGLERMMKRAEDEGRGPEMMRDLLQILAAISENPENPTLPQGAHITPVVRCEYCLRPTEAMYDPHLCWDGAAADLSSRRWEWHWMPAAVEERWSADFVLEPWERQ